MKLSMIVFGCVIVLLIFAGCHSDLPRKGVDVIIEGGGEFPASLVGRWKALSGPANQWEIVFEPDGTISAAKVAMAMPDMKPGQTNIIPLKDGQQGTFKSGLWTVQYSPLTRELTVEIRFDLISLPMGGGLLEGKRTDIFFGQISDNGEIWYADLYSYPDFIAYTDEGDKPIKAEEDAAFIGTIPFEKVQE
jgi:hypothetical protein